MLASLLEELIYEVIVRGLEVHEWVGDHVPGISRLEDAVLDTLVGPA